MKEVFEKIKEKLSDYPMWKKEMIYDLTHREHEIINKAIEIVNQVAEEYGGCELHNAKNIYDYIQTQINPYGKPFKGTVYEFGLKVMNYIKDLTNNNQSLTNDGWIPCSERLPETEEPCWITYEDAYGKLLVCEDIYCDYGGWCETEDTAVKAWMYVNAPAPYQPEGEK